MPLASAHLWPSPRLSRAAHGYGNGYGSKLLPQNWTGWWFQRFLFSISYMGCHPSHWLIFFKMVIAPPTSYSPYNWSDGTTIWPISEQKVLVLRLGTLKQKTSQFPVATDHICFYPWQEMRMVISMFRIFYFNVPSLVPFHGNAKCW